MTRLTVRRVVLAGLVTFLNCAPASEIVCETAVIKSSNSGLPKYVAIKIQNVSSKPLKLYDIGQSFYFFWKTIVEKDGMQTEYMVRLGMPWVEPELVTLVPGAVLVDTVVINPESFYSSSNCKQGCTPLIGADRFFLKYENKGGIPPGNFVHNPDKFRNRGYRGAFTSNGVSVGIIDSVKVEQEYNESGLFKFEIHSECECNGQK